jgi:hypothetical protein
LPLGWELKGVPTRVELGPRNLAASSAVLCRRDDATKVTVTLDNVVAEVGKRKASCDRDEAVGAGEPFRERRGGTRGRRHLGNLARQLVGTFGVQPHVAERLGDYGSHQKPWQLRVLVAGTANSSPARRSTVRSGA